MSANIEFWNARASVHGHTGWSNKLIYAFDQQARLKAVEHVLRRLEVPRGVALDFGAGSGDFVAILSSLFAKVIACDISDRVVDIARRRHAALRNVSFAHTPGLEDLPVADGSVDLILSVTVLETILDDDLLRETLCHLQRKLSPSGVFVTLEVTGNEDRSSSYLRFRTFESWKQIFRECGMTPAFDFGFPHPTEAPSASFVRYCRSPLVRLVARTGRFTGRWACVARFYERRARAVLDAADDYVWDGRGDDRMKIMVFRPAGGSGG